MNAVAAIVRANLRRMLNDRSNIFFLVVLPLLIVFALGSAIAGTAGALQVGVVDPAPTDASRQVRTQIDAVENVDVVDVADARTLRDRVARKVLDAGWVIATSNTGSGARTTVDWYSGVGTGTAQLRGVVEDAARSAAIRVSVVDAVADAAGVERAAAASAVARAEAAVPATPVAVETVGSASSDPASIEAVLAGGQLTLFIFLTSLFGAAQLLLTRQLGVTRRMLAAPVSPRAIIAGEAVARYVVALAQAGIIIVGCVALFGVDWRAPVAVVALSAAMALVGTGVAMLLGAVGRSEQQVTAVGLLLGLVLAAFGGSMQPLEFFPDAMRTFAFVTPHAWMNDALWRILVDGAGLADVLPAVAVLTGAGLVLLSVAARVMARRLG